MVVTVPIPLVQIFQSRRIISRLGIISKRLLPLFVGDGFLLMASKFYYSGTSDSSRCRQHSRRDINNNYDSNAVAESQDRIPPAHNGYRRFFLFVTAFFSSKNRDPVLERESWCCRILFLHRLSGAGPYFTRIESIDVGLCLTSL